MNVKAKMKSIKRGVQHGFTLLELVVVVAIMGILIAIVAPSISGSTDGSKAEMLLKVSNDIASNWSLINQSCGTSSAVASNPIPASPNTAENVVFAGSADVSATYTTCYAQSKVLPMNEVAQAVSGTPDTYTIQGVPVAITGGGASPLSVAFQNVPDSIALLMAQHYQPTTTSVTAAVTAGPLSLPGSGAAGKQTVTLKKQF